MLTRPATVQDVPAMHHVQARWETAWFGAVEESEDEAREHLERVADLDAQSRLVFDGESLMGAALWFEHDTWLAVDPDADAAAVYADLLPWLGSRGPRQVEALSRDVERQEALRSFGWRHHHSSFELFRTLDEGPWDPPAPRWPDGVEVVELRPDDAVAVHELIYVEAGWATIPGHPERSFADWHPVFLGPAIDPAQQVLARRGDRLVGVSLGRIWDDGLGWVSQLAVRRDERGRGLGRALLLESVHRRLAVGANGVGLSVQAENSGALRLYLDVGLEIDREWMTWVSTAG